MATPSYAMLAIVVNTVLTMLGATLLYMAIERPHGFAERAVASA